MALGDPEKLTESLSFLLKFYWRDEKCRGQRKFQS